MNACVSKLELLQERSEMKVIDVIKALRQRIGFFFLYNMTEDSNVQKVEIQELKKANE